MCMARFIPDRALRGGRWLLAALLALPGVIASAAQIDTGHGVLTYNAKSMDVDIKTRQAVLHGNVVMSQGEFSVTADHADISALQVRDSHWVFTGNVHIRAEQHGSLRSDRAIIDF